MGFHNVQENLQEVLEMLMMSRKEIRDIPSRARNFPSLAILSENPLKNFRRFLS